MTESTIESSVFAGLYVSFHDHIVRTTGAASPWDTAVALIPYLALAYIVVIGGAVLAHGWELFRIRQTSLIRRGVVVPPMAVIEREHNNAQTAPKCTGPTPSSPAVAPRDT